MSAYARIQSQMITFKVAKMANYANYATLAILAMLAFLTHRNAPQCTATQRTTQRTTQRLRNAHARKNPLGDPRGLCVLAT